MKLIKSLFISLSILGFSLSGLASPEVGKTAPDFELKGKDAKSVKLSSLKGKWVVLEWFNHGCPYVKKHYETNNMQKLQAKYTKKGVEWISIVSSAPGKQGYLEDTKAIAKIDEMWKTSRTNTLLDPAGEVGKLYGATNTPQMFVINPEGKIAYMGAIDDNSSSRESSVKGAKNYVAAALDEGMAGKSISVASTKPYGCSVKY